VVDPRIWLLSLALSLRQLSATVSRRRWLFSRLALALIESVALSLFAVVVLVIGSAVIHQTFSLTLMLLHALLMVAAGVFIIAFANLCYTLVPGNNLSLLLTLILLGVPYLWLQLYPAYALRGTPNMVSIFGFSPRHGRPLATHLGDHSLDVPADDMGAHNTRTRRNGGLW
jgi:putative exporter of polyketide antibiotics